MERISNYGFGIWEGKDVRGRELGALSDNLLNSVQEITFCRNFSSRTNSKHASLKAI